MKVHDVTLVMRPDMTTWNREPGPTITPFRRIAEGDTANVSTITFGDHTGTHVDAPVHFIEGGAGAEKIDPEILIGDAHVVDATSLHEDIDAEALATLELPRGAERLIFKTPNSELWNRDSFSRDFIRFVESGARPLVEARVRLVGIDYLSIGDEEAHHVLLEAGVVVVEGLDLREVEPGEYRLVCAPLKLAGAEGAPARVLLLRD